MSDAQLTNTGNHTTSFGLQRLNPIVALSVLLVVQLVLIGVVYWPSQDAPPRGTRLLDGITAEAVVALQVEDATGRSVTLVRTADGWTVDGTDGFPANGVKADDVIGKILSVTTDRLVTRTSASHSRLQVAEADFNRRLTLVDEEGNRRVLYLGVSAGGAATHIRATGDDLVYLTGQIAAWEVDPFLSGWIDTMYFSTSAESVRALHIENPHGAFGLARDQDDRWILTEASPDVSTPVMPDAIDQAAVNALVNRLSFISIQDVLGVAPPTGYSADDKLIRIQLERVPPEFTGAEGDRDDARQVVLLEFGLHADGGADSYFVKSTTSEYYVAVSSFTVENLLAARYQDLMIAAADTPDDSGINGEEDEDVAP